MAYRYFKCNVLGGFRISDLNKNIKQNDYFYIEDYICNTSRAARAAIANKWMIEIDEAEASRYIDLPGKNKTTEQQLTESTKPVIITNVAIPHVDTRSLESRQAERNIRKQAAQKQSKDDKVIVPDFNKADIAIRARQQDVCTKGDDEVLKSPVEAKKNEGVSSNPINVEYVKDLSKEIADNELLSTPNFDEKEEIKTMLKEQIDKKVRRRRKTAVEEV